MAVDLFVLHLEIIQDAASKPESACGSSGTEGRPLVDHPLVVDPEFHTLIRLGNLGMECVLLGAGGLYISAPQHAEAVDDGNIGIARLVPDVKVEL